MIKTNWKDPGAPTPDLGGDGVTSRGSDPSVDLGGSSALKTTFDKAGVPTPGGSESANSVSGLPALPNRFEPSGTPPSPPDLTDRSPGTIDKR